MQLNNVRRKKNEIFFFCMLIIGFIPEVLKASQYWPNALFFKSASEEPYFSGINVTMSGAYAHDAYNQDGNSVPFLQQYGNEDLLKRFVDPTLSSDNLESMGQGQFSGKYQFRQLIVQSTKNIMRGFFIGLELVFQDLSTSSIDVNFIPSELPLTVDQELYLEELRKKIPSTIDVSGMFTTFLLLGWHTKFDHFTSIDFLDICLSTGVVSPSSMTSNDSILRTPIEGIASFGYPVISIINLGWHEKFTFGWCGTLTPFQSRTLESFVNKGNSQNQLLLTERAFVTIHPGISFSSNFYFQALDLYKGWNAMACCAYMRGSENDVIIDVENSFSSDAWHITSLIFEIGYNFATKLKTRAPIVSGFFAMPVSGRLYQKSYLFGGSSTLQITYDF